MKRMVSRYYWFRGALLAGFLLALLLLVQSIVGYLRVSRQLVTDQAQKEAERQEATLERQLHATQNWSPENIKLVLDEMLQESASKVAWIRLSEGVGRAPIQVGHVPESPGAPPGMREMFEERRQGPQVRELDGRKILVTVLSFGTRRFGRGGAAPGRPPGSGANNYRPGQAGPIAAGGNAGERAPDASAGNRGTAPPPWRGAGGAAPGRPPGADANNSLPAQAGRAAEGGNAGERASAVSAATGGTAPPSTDARGAIAGGLSQSRPGGAPRRGETEFVEIGIYLDSVAAPFGSLSRDLIISCLAALILAGSMVFRWVQLPRYVHGKQLEQQLELARRVQTDLLPSANPSFENWDIAASCVPALQVGGDFYDVFRTDQKRMAIVLGDVSGKGIPAALLMGLIHGAVRSISWADTTEEHESSTRRLNDLLLMRTSPERFASLFWAYFVPESGILYYINAGHLPPALIRQDAAGGFSLQRLDEGGPILGAVSQAGFRQGKVPLLPGDVLVLYSDGIVEATGEGEEEFGEERLWEIVRDHWTRSASEIRDEILKQVRALVNEGQPQDDMTLVVIRVGGVKKLSDGAGPLDANDSRAEARVPPSRTRN